MGAPGRKTVDRQGYQAYITSPAWRRKRQQFIDSKICKDCQVCGAGYRSGFHLHHRTYKNLGNERLMDLMMLCPKCHNEAHVIADEGVQLWSAAKSLRKQKQKAFRRTRVA